jgi:hypothetical protein
MVSTAIPRIFKVPHEKLFSVWQLSADMTHIADDSTFAKGAAVQQLTLHCKYFFRAYPLYGTYVFSAANSCNL